MDYFLIGNPLGHSYSPFVHAFYGYDYGLKVLTEDELAPFFAARDFKGINVTIPYKQKVIPFLDEVHPLAASCGAINTVVNQNGRLVGYNTDLFGAEYTLHSAGITLTDRNVVILGSGGTSQILQAAAKRAHARSVSVVSRQGAINYDNCYQLTETKILLNATPCGMYPKTADCPIDISVFPRLTGVFDAIYNPVRTRLIQSALDKNIRCAGGACMLAAQAKKASMVFKGKPFADDSCTYDDLIDHVTASVVRHMQNIVLIGMPGSGKTTVGKILAQTLGKDFVDTDEEIEKTTNQTIPQIFAEQGETYFRALERETINTHAKRQNTVIATGGGAVMDMANVQALKQNGICVELKREIALLSREGRPLSANADALEKLYAQRAPIYQSIADFSVNNDCTAEKTAKQISDIYLSH